MQEGRDREEAGGVVGWREEEGTGGRGWCARRFKRRRVSGQRIYLDAIHAELDNTAPHGTAIRSLHSAVGQDFGWLLHYWPAATSTRVRSLVSEADSRSAVRSKATPLPHQQQMQHRTPPCTSPLALTDWRPVKEPKRKNDQNISLFDRYPCITYSNSTAQITSITYVHTISPFIRSRYAQLCTCVCVDV